MICVGLLYPAIQKVAGYYIIPLVSTLNQKLSKALELIMECLVDTVRNKQNPVW